MLSEELSLSSCPLGHQYDPDLHDAISHLRILDGSLPEHPKHGRAVTFFAPERTAKYWVKSSSPVFGYVKVTPPAGCAHGCVPHHTGASAVYYAAAPAAAGGRARFSLGATPGSGGGLAPHLCVCVWAQGPGKFCVAGQRALRPTCVGAWGGSRVTIPPRDVYRSGPPAFVRWREA